MLKQKALIGQEKRIFTSSNLALLWNIEKKNTLWTTINRYVNREILHRLSKGLYSTLPIENLNPYELGCALCGPYSYVSAESVLQSAGIIMQKVNKITLFGKKKREFTINNTAYFCRFLNIAYLLNREGINNTGHYSIASVDRATGDMLYINPRYHFDNNSGINMTAVNDLSKKVGYR